MGGQSVPLDPRPSARSFSSSSLAGPCYARGGGKWSLQGRPRSASSSEPSQDLGLQEDGAEAMPIHAGNIHERRRVATFARCFPLAFFLAVVALALLGAVRWPALLLALCAVFNTCLCAVMSMNGVYCIIGTTRLAPGIWGPGTEERDAGSGWAGGGSSGGPPEEAPGGTIVHLIIIPNYREDEMMLSQTLQSIAEAQDSSSFHVALAMEYREGKAGEQKAHRLQERFQDCFARLVLTTHPPDLVECHLDGSEDDEVPGKASNLKWAVQEMYKAYKQERFPRACDVLLTVADADVIFHPAYFSQVGQEFQTLREAPGSEHQWTMWQAPQLPFRNYRDAPLCSRIWAYVASAYEFGGVTSLSYGGQHLAFSTYSMPLLLAVKARAHEGDVIAEDHHAFLRCFFYSARAAALEAIGARGGGGPVPCGAGCGQRLDRPRLRLRPVYLPVKATSVVSEEGCVQTWVDRWFQAKRHAQGVAELSYMVLAMCDTVCHLPAELRTQIMLPMWQLFFRLLYIHCFPACQFAVMGVLAGYYFCNEWSFPMCQRRTAQLSDQALCALAGTSVPAWPIAVPMVLILVSNVLLVSACFLRPLEGRRGGLWHSEGGGLRPTCGSVRATLAFTVAADLLLFGGPLVVPYGVVVEVMAFWSVCLRGNRFEYVTATKAMSLPSPLRSPVSERRLLHSDEEGSPVFSS